MYLTPGNVSKWQSSRWGSVQSLMTFGRSNVETEELKQ